LDNHKLRNILDSIFALDGELTRELRITVIIDVREKYYSDESSECSLILVIPIIRLLATIITSIAFITVCCIVLLRRSLLKNLI